MKLIIIMILVLSPELGFADLWTQKADFTGTSREHPFMFSIGTKGYVGAGKSSLTVLNDLWEYDPSTNAWTQKANFPGIPRQAPVGFSIGAFGYAGTGCNFGNNVYYDDFWEYDPVSNSWSQKSNFGAGVRGWACGFAIGNKGYIGTGGNNSGFYNNDLWEWDQATDTWTQKSSMPSLGRFLAVGFSINNKGYISTGRTSSGMAQNDCWEYNPALNNWVQKANLPGNGREDAAAFSICDKGFLGIGGEAPYYTDFYEFDPLLNQWVQKTDFPGLARDDAAFFSIGNKGYIGLGQYNNNVNYIDFYEYTPDSNVCAPILPVISISCSDSIFCENKCLNFFDLSANNPTTWQWYFPGASPNTSTMQNPTNICYINYGVFSVTLVACNANGCDSVTYSNFISEFPEPPVNLGNDTTICINDSLILDAGLGFISYLWNNGATSQTILVNGPGTYSLIVNNGVCDATDTIIITTQNCNFPIIALASSDTGFCEKQCINFFDLSTNSPTSWQWHFPGASPDTSTLQNPTGICYNTYGNYNVTLVACNANGCDSLLLNNFITCFKNPVDSIYQSNDTLYSLPAYSYQWYETSGGLIAGATNQFYVFSQSGSYFCVVTDSVGCEASSNVVVITAVPPLAFEEVPGVRIMPNPSDGIFEIILYNQLYFADCLLRITNTMGQSVFNSTKLLTPNSQPLKLDISYLENGIYFLEITIDNERRVMKIIKN